VKVESKIGQANGDADMVGELWTFACRKTKKCPILWWNVILYILFANNKKTIHM